MPSFLSRLGLGFVCFLHALALFCTRWSIDVRCFAYYSSLPSQLESLEVATALRVDPHKHKGKPVVAPLQWMELSSFAELDVFLPSSRLDELQALMEEAGDGKGVAGENEGDEPVTLPYFVFQEIKYIFHPDLELWLRVECPDDAPISTYLDAPGLDETDVDDTFTKFGLNEYAIESPTFKDLYIERLMAPTTVFQFFCVLLWCLDDYWKYSLFTLFMLLIFEATVSFSRLKSLSTLRAMNNTARNIYVYRSGSWKHILTNALLPGDIVSIRKTVTQTKTMETLKARIEGAASSSSSSAPAAPAEEVDASTNTVPCDCILLTGSVVVNEANLTGESVPQLKEGMVAGVDMYEYPRLDIDNEHKVNMVFGGTTLLQHTGTSETLVRSGDPRYSPPDNGAVAYVLRTGFLSSQGKLVRMIQFGSEKVTGGTYEVLLLMGFLLVFAVISSGYVLYKGMYDPDRDQFDLLLHCILIVTSVIPPDLNMQLAMSVNSSLMTLMKASIFCTEPFRIPFAGKVDVTLFDKTGTITTDKLVADAIVTPGGSASPKEAPLLPRIVLAGCHSLVQVNGATMGDPLEEEALKSTGATFDAGVNVATIPQGTSARILHRHHFASKLQRMSVLASVAVSSGSSTPSGLYVLVKGSPEALFDLLSKSSVDAVGNWYHQTYQKLAKDGKRVLALAHKHVKGPSGVAAVSEAADAMFEGPRSVMESDLVFDGFIVFSCAVRADSADVVTELRESSHSVVMITGDALFTAVHVARNVNIVDAPSAVYVLQQVGDVAAGGDGEEEDVRPLAWVDPFSSETVGEPIVVEEADVSSSKAFQEQVQRLADGAALGITGKALARAAEVCSDGIWRSVGLFAVFARMTPELKERVLASLKEDGVHTMMCGDGANDVGALKQAHVGLALLSGFGNANVAAEGDGDKKAVVKKGGKKDEAKKKKKKEEKALTKAELAEKKAEAAKKQREEYAAKMAEVEANIKRRSEAGESFASMKEWYAFMQREMEAAKKKKMAGRPKNFAESAAMLAAQEDLADGGGGEIPMVKLGDASIASPFTSKKPSIRGAVDVIRQGRCTLVTTLQMYQILALSCLISSYSLSVLYLDAVKFGDTQMTATGLLMTVSYFAISMAKPLPRLSEVKPLTSIFHPALFLSLLAQFAIHLVIMVYSVSLAKSFLPEDAVLSIDGEFEPNLVNTIVYLISSVQNVCVFAVNVKGRPFQYGITENRALLWSLGLVVLGAFVCAFEISPLFNDALQLVAFPDTAFRWTIVGLLLVDVVGTFVVDRFLLAVFAPAIFRSALKDITWASVWTVARNVVGLGLLFYYVIIPMFLMDPEEWEEWEEQ